MFINFFVKRFVFTVIVSLVTVFTGIISILNLPVAQYPNISPVQIIVSANYIGASSQIVEETVTTVLEKEINGVEGMRYMTSTSSDEGKCEIIITFEQGYDINIAFNDVSNRVSLSESQLPEVIQKTGVSVKKESSGNVLGIMLFSENEKYDINFLSNYADLYIVDSLRRVDGVSDLVSFGVRRYAMRLWLDPHRLAIRGLTTEDVIEAVEEQNLQIGAGRIGQAPAPDGQLYQFPVQVVGRLSNVSEFESIVLKVDSDGSLTKLKDIGRVELGAESYDTFARYSNRESINYLVRQTSNSNAIDVAKAVKARMAELAENFPPGLTYEIPYDTTSFIIESRNELVKTIIQAILLVILVLFLFLQNWRITLIPAIIIPISLIGTFAFIKIFGFSINSLTLLGLTLVTGIVVDDAIVVVENIVGKVQEEKKDPRLATIETMQELSGAIIATSLVLLAVFIPVAFLTGTNGQLYKQFALTIAFAVVISTFNALTLTPVLSSVFLCQHKLTRGSSNWIFAKINRNIERGRQTYYRVLNYLVRFKFIVLFSFIGFFGLTVWLYVNMPTAFIPEEDQGYVISLVQGPDGTSLQYTDKVISQVDRELLKNPEIAETFSLGGFGFTGNVANSGATFALFSPWSERKKNHQSAQAILAQVAEPLSQIKKAKVISFNPPTIQGLGNLSGFVFHLQDQGNNDINTLVQIRDKLVNHANERPELENVFSAYTANSPRLLIEIDRDIAKSLQVSIDDILNTLQTFLGSRYINNFNSFGQTYKVYAQADTNARSHPDDIKQMYVRSDTGQMISLENLIQVISTTGAQTINHYNLLRSIEINGVNSSDYSSGQAMAAMEEVAHEILPPSMSFEWSGISLEELESSNQMSFIFGCGVILVFLTLAAQYENFVEPFIIILAVPLAVLGAIIAQYIRGLPNDIYSQVGLVMLIGLASKNAILIVEFANQLQKQGFSVTKAALKAAKQRLRPIIMTAISTLLGIFPLVIATGAGAIGRKSLGTAVFGGMITSTVLNLFMVPILYIIVAIVWEKLSHSSTTALREQTDKKQHYPN